MMSHDLIVYLQDARMPTPEIWRNHISRAGFPVELHTDFDPRLMTGFLPAKVRGFIAGFEYYYTTASEEELIEAGLNGKADQSVLFCTLRNKYRELIAALAAASTLASITGGLLVDPQSGEKIHGADAIFWARSSLERLEMENAAK